MGLPSGVSTATVTFGTDADVLGVGATTTLTITPSHTLIWAATGEIVRAFSVSVDAAANVVGSFEIPHTDQVGFTDELGRAITNWYYTVAGLVTRGGEVQPYRKVFQVASDVVTMNLDLVPVDGVVRAVGTAPVPAVTSVVGATGPVDAATIFAAIEPDLQTTIDSVGRVKLLAPQLADAEAQATQALRRLSTGSTFTWSNGNSWQVMGLTKGGGRLVAVKDDAVNGLEVGYSDNDGTTWTSIGNLPVANAKYVSALLVLDTGEVLIAALNGAKTGAYRCYLYRSSGFAANPGTATWSLVFTTPFAESNTAPWSQYSGLVYDGEARLMGAWYDKKTNNSGGVANNAGVRVRYSADRGTTWTEVFNLNTYLTGLGVDTLATGYHVHGVAYDPIWDAWWVSYGDRAGGVGEYGVLYSLDNGATWTSAVRGTDAYQAVGIYPAANFILLAGDGGSSSGINRIARGINPGEIGALSKGYTPPYNAAIGLGGLNPQRKGEPFLFPIVTITGTDRLSRIVGTGNGSEYIELFVDNEYTVSNTAGFRWIVGPTKNGRYIATSYNDGRYAGDTSLLTIDTAVTRAQVGVAGGIAALDANGLVPDDSIPSDGLDMSAAAEYAVPRALVVSTIASWTSGDLYLSYFTARRTTSRSSVRTATHGTAAAATPTLCRIGIYEEATNGNLTLIGSIANDTALWAATYTGYTRALSAAVNLVRGKRYAVGVLIVSSATRPALCAGAATLPAFNDFGPRLNGRVASQTDLPSSIASGSISATTGRPFAMLT